MQCLSVSEFFPSDADKRAVDCNMFNAQSKSTQEPFKKAQSN